MRVDVAPALDAASPVEASAQPEHNEFVTSIKGFDADLRCRGYQFALGGTFTHAGRVEACHGGFHAIEGHPLEVFDYYPPAGSRFAEVRQSGELSRHGNDSKLASAKISIGVELSIGDLVARTFKWVWDRCKLEHETSIGYRGAASSTGNRGAASSTGDQGAASSTGYQGAASSIGYRGAASSTGYQGAASSTGNRGAASSTGNRGAASSTGDQGAASSTGYRGAALSTGDRGSASSTGTHSVAIATGIGARTMATETNGVCLARRGEDGRLIALRASMVGQNGIKAGVYYSLSADGDFIEEAGVADV